METRKVDLLRLSDSEKDKVLKQAKTYLQEQKEEAKIHRAQLAHHSRESEVPSFSFFPRAPRYTMLEQKALFLELARAYNKQISPEESARA